MRKFILLLAIFFNYSIAQASDPAVDPLSVSITGTSSVTKDTTGAITEVYGGIAGNPCTDASNTATCSSCGASTALQACNLTSIYPSLKVTISFNTSVAIGTNATGTVLAQLYVVTPGSTGFTGTAINSNESLTLPVAAGTHISFTTTWSVICAAAGFTSACVARTPPATDLNYATLAFGIDTSGSSSGALDWDETKRITAKIQIIPPNGTDTQQSYCGTATAVGVCSVVLKAGDNKAVISSFPAAVGADPLGYDWDGIAFFKVEIIPPGDTTLENAAFSNFKGAADPHIQSMDATGKIGDANITGNLENYHEYCFVYGTKNRAQNIYKYVIDPVAPPGACVTPSEVVGLLDDKHCFISTAAFGSDMAPEVQTFREFRNKYLLNNSFGKAFVHIYNKISPPIANIISESEILRAITRTFLYPLLAFIHLCLNYGLTVAFFVLAVLLILAFKVREIFRYKKTFLIVLILLMTPFLKAQERPQTKKIIHPDAAAEGLIRIDKDGNYIYDLKRPLKSESGNLRFGQSQDPDIAIEITPASGGAAQTYHFKDFYKESSNLMLGYDYEWFPYLKHGKLGVQAGASVMFAKGHGRLKSDPTIESEEAFSFFTVPITLGGVYRLQYKDRQILAPYVSGGGSYLLLAEKREDKSSANFAGGFGYYASAGMLFNLSYLDADMGYSLESEYGISNLWLSLELKTVEVQASAFGFTSQYLNAGLSFDF